MRALWLLALGGLIACSGASPTEFDDPVVAAPASNTPDTDDPDAPVTSKGPNAATGGSAGAPGKTPPDRAAADECVSEEEDNGSAAKATVFTSCVKGVLDGSRDQDFVQIEAPQGAERVSISHESKNGRVAISVFAKAPLTGLPIPVGTVDEDSSTLRVIGGATYIIKVSLPPNQGDRKTERPWRLEVAFE